MFSKPASKELSDRWVAVRVLAGDDLDEAGRRFLERYGVDHFPSCLAVSAAGALVDPDLLRRGAGSPRDLVEAMTRADRRQRAFVAERDRALRSNDPAALKGVAAELVRQHDDAGARAIYEMLLREAPDPELYDALFDVLDRLGDRVALRAELEQAVVRLPAAHERLRWRMRLATLRAEMEHPEGAHGQADAERRGLERLAGELEREGKTEEEAEVRVRLVGLADRVGDAAERDRQAKWIREHAPDGAARRDLDLTLAEGAMARGDLSGARARAQAVLERAPSSAQAAHAHMILAEVAASGGDRSATREHLEAVVRLAPDSDDAGVARRMLQGLR